MHLHFTFDLVANANFRVRVISVYLANAWPPWNKIKIAPFFTQHIMTMLAFPKTRIVMVEWDGTAHPGFPSPSSGNLNAYPLVGTSIIWVMMLRSHTSKLEWEACTTKKTASAGKHILNLKLQSDKEHKHYMWHHSGSNVSKFKAIRAHLHILPASLEQCCIETTLTSVYTYLRILFVYFVTIFVTNSGHIYISWYWLAKLVPFCSRLLFLHSLCKPKNGYCFVESLDHYILIALKSARGNTPISE